MCGITGYYSPYKYETNTNKIFEMTELIRHRGPDDEGYTLIDIKNNNFTNASGIDSPLIIKEKLQDIKSLSNVPHNIAFGHRRYAIIDLSPGGHQPFWEEDHAICISFNGEIYNYIELKEELEQKGYKFITASDTEILVKSYIEWGENCFKKFNGTWALSIYDANKHRLILSRDRIGKNPLYYTIRNNTLYWSSEIKSLLFICGKDAFSINEQAIYDFIYFGLRDLDNNTFFNKIHTIPASTFYIFTENEITENEITENEITENEITENEITENSLNFKEKVYWKIPDKRFQNGEITFDQAKEKLKYLLIDALNIRLRSDIPVGFALSGGMDSSSLLALYTQILHKRTVSFTIKFTQKGTNEEPFAHKVAEKCGELVDYRVLEPSFNDFWKDADDYFWLIEEPFHSPTVYVEQCLQKRLKSEGFGVMIHGNGGDELLAGYEYLYFPLYLVYLLHNDKLSFVKECFSWIGKDYQTFNRTLFAIIAMNPNIRKFFKKILYREHSFLQHMVGVKQRDLPNNFNDYMIGNMGQLLMNYWMIVGNKSNFAIPMEIRCPFLDYRLVEFIFKLPPEYLVHNGWHKYVLRKTVEELLPKDVVWRKNKMGFPFPYSEWLKSSKPIIENNLKNIICPYVDSKKLFDKYDVMVKSDPILLWRYISLLLWWKRVILGEHIVNYKN